LLVAALAAAAAAPSGSKPAAGPLEPTPALQIGQHCCHNWHVRGGCDPAPVWGNGFFARIAAMTIGGGGGWGGGGARRGPGRRAQAVVRSETRDLLKLLARPNIISFAGGIPDPALFPVGEVAAAYQRVLSDPAAAGASLQYSVSEGYLPLRQWIVGYMARLGV